VAVAIAFVAMTTGAEYVIKVFAFVKDLLIGGERVFQLFSRTFVIRIDLCKRIGDNIPGDGSFSRFAHGLSIFPNVVFAIGLVSLAVNHVREIFIALVGTRAVTRPEHYQHHKHKQW